MEDVRLREMVREMRHLVHDHVQRHRHERDPANIGREEESESERDRRRREHDAKHAGRGDQHESQLTSVTNRHVAPAVDVVVERRVFLVQIAEKRLRSVEDVFVRPPLEEVREQERDRTHEELVPVHVVHHGERECDGDHADGERAREMRERRVPARHRCELRGAEIFRRRTVIIHGFSPCKERCGEGMRIAYLRQSHKNRLRFLADKNTPHRDGVERSLFVQRNE